MRGKNSASRGRPRRIHEDDCGRPTFLFCFGFPHYLIWYRNCSHPLGFLPGMRFVVRRGGTIQHMGHDPRREGGRAWSSGGRAWGAIDGKHARRGAPGRRRTSRVGRGASRIAHRGRCIHRHPCTESSGRGVTNQSL